MAILGRRRRHGHGIPTEARAVVAARPGEHVLSVAHDDASDATLVAGRFGVYAVRPDGEVALERPWHLVDGGAWDHETFTLTVTWVDRHPRTRWVLKVPNAFPETFRERVQASVVLTDTVSLDGRRTARVVLRQDLATGEMLGQTLLGRGVRSSDPGVIEQTEAALDRLREQVGLA
ncbi:DNA primase [Nostocoides japonicum T1-X7]|uniref:DNA primase n=1 Tax=Nostocoides japonicum T1-X7 TaxID=1194083 RepID=A0A077LY09_9MICO|nr:hypothetical protein [Tetrasphaera japonica]CCH78556.1 DNA primase [Tetrasphaera japonica T1-X7]